MIRTISLTLALAAGAATAENVQFAYVAGSPVIAGLNSQATLTADASTFTITFQNNTPGTVMTGFYIEAGTALAGLGAASISHSDGVRFVSPNTGASLHVPGLDPFQGALNTDQGHAQTQRPGQNASIPGGTPTWSGSFFGMTSIDAEYGLDAGENLSVTFSHDGNFSLPDLVAAIENDEIDFIKRYHNSGAIDTTTGWLGSSNIAIVPLPPAAWAGLGTLGAVAGVRAFKRRSRA